MTERAQALEAAIDYLRAQQAHALKFVPSRRESARVTREMTAADERAARKMAERMSGRRLPVQTESERARSAEINDRIADKDESEAARLGAMIQALVAAREEAADEEASFDLRWKADMRAIAKWREAHPGNELVMPDHADLCVWLLDQLAVPPRPPVGSPTTPDMGQGWFVTAGRWGDSIVTIEEKSLSGKPDFTPEDQALVRGAALHLLAFIGQPTPVEPAGASEPPSEDEDDDVPLSVPEGAADAWGAPLRKPVPLKILSTDDFYALLRILELLPADPFLTDLQAKLADEERRQHGNRASHLSGSEFVREIGRVEDLIQSRLRPAPVSPVAPEPPTETRSELWEVREQLAALAHEQWAGWMAHVFRKCEQREGGWWMPAEWADRWLRQIATPYLFLTPSEQDSDRKEAERVLGVMLTVAPTGAPAPCVWRWHDDNDCYYSACANTAKHDQPTMGWKVCPYCKAPFRLGHPLAVER